MTAPATAGAPVRARTGPATAGLLIGMLLSVLDQTVVAIALPAIAADLGGMAGIGWVVTSYLLASTATGPLYARLSDRFGRRAVFTAAITVFLAGSALCGLAQTLPQLVAARTVQGLGAGALFVLPTVALSELYPQRLRGRVQGLTGAVFALASVGGPLAGGAITDAWGWRWIFHVNLPLGLLALALTAWALRLPRPPGGGGRTDLAGAALLAGATTAVLLVAEWGGTAWAWTSGTAPALAVAAAVLAALFVWRERRAPDPLLPPRLFAVPALRVLLPACGLLGVLLGGSVFFLPAFLQAAYGMGATQAGLALNPYVLVFMAVSTVAGSRVGATGRFTPVLVAGAVVAAAGFVLLGALGPGTPYAVFAAEIALLGAGFGLLMQNLVVAAQNAAAPADLAAVSSAAVVVRGLGLALGVAAFSGLLTRELAGAAGPEATAAAVPDVLLWGAPAAAALAALLLLLRGAPARGGARPEAG